MSRWHKRAVADDLGVSWYRRVCYVGKAVWLRLCEFSVLTKLRAIETGREGLSIILHF